MKLLEPGTLIDGFEVGRCIHAGGMAHIYEVQHAQGTDGTRRPAEFPMAMKIPRMTAGDGAENILSFEVELMILPALTGPHVPRFVASGDLSRLPYLVMEYIEGHTLTHWLEDRAPLDPLEIARLGAAVARAAHSLHRQNVCHCLATHTTPTCWPRNSARRWAHPSGSPLSKWWACAATRAAMCLRSA